MRVNSTKSSEKRQVLPSSNRDPFGSQAGPSVPSAVVSESVFPIILEESSMSSRDVQYISHVSRNKNDFSSNVQVVSNFQTEVNAFPMNSQAEMSVDSSN